MNTVTTSLPYMTTPHNLTESILASGLISPRTRRSIAWAHDYTTERTPRPTPHECCESAAAFGGCHFATAAAWGFVRDSDSGEWIDLLSEPDDSARIGLVRNTEGLLALACFAAHFGVPLPIEVRIGRYGHSAAGRRRTN